MCSRRLGSIPGVGAKHLKIMKKCDFYIYLTVWEYRFVNPAILEAAKKPIFESPKGFEIEDTWEDIEF